MPDTRPAFGMTTLGRYGLGPDGGFDEKFFASYTGNFGSTATPYEQYSGRLQRYNTFWRLYENNVYREVNSQAAAIKSKYGLYSAIRNIYCPAYRIGEFWAGKLQSGSLDAEGGDGKDKASALPVVVANRGNPESPEEVRRVSDLRLAVSKVWRDSNWQVNKDICSRFGAVLGDVGIQVVDDPVKRQVYLKIIHPRIIRDLHRDSRGNVKGYVFQEPRPDPRVDSYSSAFVPTVTYTETASRQGESVVFETFLDAEPYDWRDYDADGDTNITTRIGPTWSEPYGFIPLVVIQHRNLGLDWGISELFAGLSKLHELDDLASMLGDQIRKVVAGPRLIAGALPPSVDEEGNSDDRSLVVEFGDAGDSNRNNSSAIRTKYPFVYSSDPNVKAIDLVGTLDIDATSRYVAGILAEIERDHPELQADMATSSGDASGRALRVARERVEAMVSERRVNYDDALVRITQMAISIGAMEDRQYDPAFAPFTPDSYKLGLIDFQIGDRPVFAVDEADRLEVSQMKAVALETFTRAGMPLEMALLELGYDPTQAAKIIATRDAEAAKAMKLASQAQGSFFGGDDEGEGDEPARGQSGTAA